MRFTILSWNIEHLRFEKLVRNEQANNLRTFYDVMQQADIAFLYEAKGKTVVKSVLDYLNAVEDLAPKMELKVEEVPAYNWDGDWFDVSLGELVVCFWDMARVKTVEELTGVEARFQDINLGERLPACAFIELHSGHKICVGAWHCAGPAVTQAKSVKGKFRNIEGLDLLFGDFNFEALRNMPMQNPDPNFMLDDTPVYSTPKKVAGVAPNQLTQFAVKMSDDEKVPVVDKSFQTFMSVENNPNFGRGKRQTALMDEVHAVGKQMPSTITENGPVKNRMAPLDRVFACQSMKNCIQVIQYKAKDPEAAKALTDHVPVFIVINIGD